MKNNEHLIQFANELSKYVNESDVLESEILANISSAIIKKRVEMGWKEKNEMSFLTGFIIGGIVSMFIIAALMYEER